MIFKFNFCAYNLVWTVQKFGGIVVMVVETKHAKDTQSNNNRGNRLGIISWESVQS
jgi:hypothetical protein